MKLIKMQINTAADGTWQKIVSGIGRGPTEEINDRSLFQSVGFTSIPKNGDVGVALVEGDNISVIATVDNEDDRPVLSAPDKCAMYADKTKYIKLDSDGNITADNGSATQTLKANGDILSENDNGKILLKANGDIELQSTGSIKLGTGALKKLINEDIITSMAAHTHSGVTVGGGLTGPPTYAPPLALSKTTITEAV